MPYGSSGDNPWGNSGIGSAATGAGASALGSIIGGPIGMLLPLVLSFLFSSGGDKQTQETTSETTNPRYRSPALGLMEPGILSALMGNMQALGGAGMPGGKSRFGPNSDAMFNDVLAMLMKEWPAIQEGYNNPAPEKKKPLTSIGPGVLRG